MEKKYMNKKKIISITTISMMIILVLSSISPQTIAADSVSIITIRGDIYIDNVQIEEADILVILTFPDGNETDLTSATGHYQLDWDELSQHIGFSIGVFSVIYNSQEYIPDNDVWTKTDDFAYFKDLFIISPPNNPGGDGDGDNPPVNNNPIANASAGEPYQGYVDNVITFDGSLSYAIDGKHIILWYWKFGDDTNDSGEIVTHMYSNPGAYTVTLTVTDNDNNAGVYETTAFITQPNRSPTAPIITGEILGYKNTEYTYTVESTDADNDPIKYIFDWGDNTTNESEFLPSGTSFSIGHIWTSAGQYTISVQAADDQTATISELTVFIDAVNVAELGYLIDNDGDGIYDVFYNDATGQETAVKQNGGETYLVDSDGDNQWNYIYDPETGTITEYDEGDAKAVPVDYTPFIPLGIGIIILGLGVLIFLIIKKKLPFKMPTKKAQKK